MTKIPPEISTTLSEIGDMLKNESFSRSHYTFENEYPLSLKVHRKSNIDRLIENQQSVIFTEHEIEAMNTATY